MVLVDTTLGTWRLDEAVESHWNKHQLDADFRRKWSNPTATTYQPVDDGQARPSPPGPYCVFTSETPTIVARMTGTRSGETRVIVSWPFTFAVHAKSTASESGKEISQWLARKVAEAFDPNQPVEIDGAAHVQTERGPDWPRREGDDETVWTLRFRWLVDASIRISDVQIPESSSSSTESSSSESSSSSGALIEEDDVLDFGDIGGVYDSQAAGTANVSALNTYLATRTDDSVALKFGGPRDYNTKRQPGDVYFELSGGTIAIDLGGAGKLIDLQFFGPSKIYGVNAATATTPIFTVTRTVGTMPQILFSGLVFESDGSGLKFVNGGSGLVLQDVRIDDFTGSTSLDQDSFDDVDNDTCSYGIRIEEADGIRLQNVQIPNGSGHGIIATRLHASDIQARVQAVAGIAFKFEQMNGCRGDIWAESNEGFGLYLKDSGVDRFVDNDNVAENGAPNDLTCWFEANNKRGTAYTSSGYSFSQFKIESSARITLAGHSGWRANMATLDRFSRLRNILTEEKRTDVSATADLELVTSNTVSADVVLAADGVGQSAITNFDTIWTNASYRPVTTKVGTPGVDERIRVTWPVDCFDSTDVQDSAYWSPFGLEALDSPGSFYYEVEVQDVDGEIASYCNFRDGEASRQRSFVGGFQINPVSGAIAAFPLWDTNIRKFSGSMVVDDTRSDIVPSFVAWMSGMEDDAGTAPQNSQHVMDILQWRMWKMIG